MNNKRMNILPSARPTEELGKRRELSLTINGGGWVPAGRVGHISVAGLKATSEVVVAWPRGHVRIKSIRVERHNIHHKLATHDVELMFAHGSRTECSIRICTSANAELRIADELHPLSDV